MHEQANSVTELYVPKQWNLTLDLLLPSNFVHSPPHKLKQVHNVILTL